MRTALRIFSNNVCRQAVLLGVVLALASVGSAEPLTSSEEQDWRSRIKMALFAGGALPALAAENHGSFEPEPGVVAERISYATQFGMRVPVILYRPKTVRAKAPALIVVNGHGGDKYSWYAMYSGIMYARAGAVVLTYDPRAKASATANANRARAPMTKSSHRPSSRNGSAG